MTFYWFIIDYAFFLIFPSSSFNIFYIVLKVLNNLKII